MPKTCTDKDKAEDGKKWYVLRDLRRANAKVRAFQILAHEGLEVFTPMKWAWETHAGKRTRVKKPAIPDLLLVHATQTELEPHVTAGDKLQFRFIRGGVERKMTVGDSDMARFIRVASESASIEYYTPEEFKPDRIGKTILIKGGPLDGEEAVLLDVQGEKRKHIIVRLSNLFVAVIELK